MTTYSTTIKCRPQKGWRCVAGTEINKCEVIKAEGVGAWQDVGIGVNSRNQLAQDDAEREDVAGLVVPKAVETLRTHPVRRSDGVETEFSAV
jgi:hypothetical protein